MDNSACMIDETTILRHILKQLGDSETSSSTAISNHISLDSTELGNLLSEIVLLAKLDSFLKKAKFEYRGRHEDVPDEITLQRRKNGMGSPMKKRCDKHVSQIEYGATGINSPFVPTVNEISLKNAANTNQAPINPPAFSTNAIDSDPDRLIAALFQSPDTSQALINPPASSTSASHSEPGRFIDTVFQSPDSSISASPAKVTHRVSEESNQKKEKKVSKVGKEVTAKSTNSEKHPYLTDDKKGIWQGKVHLTKNKNQVDEPDNDYEAKLMSDIVPPNEIEVTFDDVGALKETKRLIHELVILPLKRPELFTGGLLKPCRGILLFGPPGTGKTMLAKAIAKESGANFISVSLSSIFCKWVGESNKNVKALFTLATKVAPTVIFVDEIDSMLGRRTSDEFDSTSRKVKNEFMSLWDGLRTEAGKHVVVLGATNRPFDLDEAIIRRFERRILVDLPCKNSRESIFKKLLAREDVKSMDYEELALMKEGYTGSDLKNLCITAAYQPLRELLEQERLAGSVHQKQVDKAVLRPLNMDDIRQAKKQVAASFSADSSIMNELQKWNNMYGEGGTRN